MYFSSVLSGPERHDERFRQEVGEALHLGGIVKPAVLRRMPGFVRDLYERIALLATDPSDLADVGLVVEVQSRRIGKRDDLHRKATRPGQVEQPWQRGAAGFRCELEEMPGHHQHPEDRELSGGRPVKKADDVRLLIGRDHLGQSESRDAPPLEGLAGSVDETGALNAKGEGYGGRRSNPLGRLR